MYFKSSFNESAKPIRVSEKMATKWGIFNGLTYEAESTIDIDIDQDSLELVVEYYSIIDCEDVDIPKPLPYEASFVLHFTNALGNKLRTHAMWIDKIAQLKEDNQERLQLWRLFEAANLLHAQKLLDLCSARIAFEFKNMKPAELRRVLHI
jgi:hypothetical protein